MTPIYVSEYHHSILNAWAEIRRGRKTPFRLVTFDFHTDTLPAFSKYAAKWLKLELGRSGTAEELTDKGQALVAAVDFADATSVREAVAKLNHDEHIDCALRAQILDKAAVILSTDVPGNTRDIALLFPAAKICGVDPTPQICGMDPTPHVCDLACERALAAGLLDSAVLAPKIAAIAAAWGGLGDYIVDIDLDFFRSLAAASPRDASAFTQLLHGALAITIARESRCVLAGRLPTESITADTLLAHLQRFFS